MLCRCCGSARFVEHEVLWKELIDAWRLAPHEVAYVNRQQGLKCGECGANLRSMALAAAIMSAAGYTGRFKAFVKGKGFRGSRILEINEAGGLAPFFAKLPRHFLATYPQVDMTALPYKDKSFDWVVHSDTLEHVPHPVRALSECRRVLKPGGYCAFTVPVIVDRLTTSREGLPPSYHGSSANPADYLVFTEYGADAWKHVLQAGFAECRLFALDYPAALALVGVR